MNDKIAFAATLNEADYTTDDWTALVSALESARLITTGSTQADADIAANELKTAIAELIESSEA